MKTKKVVAAVIGTALVGTMAFGLTACKDSDKSSHGSLGTTNELNIADYATDYADSYYANETSKDGYTAVKMLIESNSNNYGDNQMVVPKDGRYAVYDLRSEKYILSDLLDRPQSDYIGGLNVWKVTSSTDKATYYAEDGTEILANGNYRYLSASSMGTVYVGNDTEASRVYKITGTEVVNPETYKAVEKYVKCVVDEKTNIAKYSTIDRKDIKIYDGEEAAGTVHNGAYSVYDDNEDYPVEGDAADYKYIQVGNKLTFYKGSDKKGTVDIKNGELLAFVGNYLYYYEQIPVTEDGAYYNVRTVSHFYSGSNGVTTLDMKFDYSLYKYDFVNDSTTEVKTDVVVTRMTAIYNYTSKSYDAAVIGGVRMTDGVAATVNYSAGYNYVDEVTYFTDSNLKVGYDMTGIFSGAPSFYKIADDRYLIGSSYIVDGNFNVIMRGVTGVYKDAGLVGFTSSKNNKLGFADYDGKVVLSPEYNNYYDNMECGGVIKATNAYGETVLLTKSGVTVNISDITKDTSKNVNIYSGYYQVTTTTVSGTKETYKVEVYAFSGKLLKSFNHNRVSFYGDYIVEHSEDAYDTIYKYYKLV